MTRVVEPTLNLAVGAVPADMAVIDEALRLARGEADAIERFAAEQRLASFRRYLQATVDGMSALVPDVLALAGADVDRALDCVRPGHLWPGGVARRSRVSGSGSGASPRGAKARPVQPAVSAHWQHAPRVGDAVMAEGLFGPWVEVAIMGRTLEVTLRGDGSELSTRGGVAHLGFGGGLPETVVALCPGRALDEVVDHPLLRGRGHVVGRAASHGGRSVVTFDVGRTGLVPPWADLAA